MDKILQVFHFQDFQTNIFPNQDISCKVWLSHSPNIFSTSKSLCSYKIFCTNFLFEHTCQIFCSLAKADSATAAVVPGSCEFCQVRVMNMRNKGQIWPNGELNVNTQLFRMFYVCLRRLKWKTKKKNLILKAFWKADGIHHKLFYSILIFVLSPWLPDDLKDFF